MTELILSVVTAHSQGLVWWIYERSLQFQHFVMISKFSFMGKSSGQRMLNNKNCNSSFNKNIGIYAKLLCCNKNETLQDVLLSISSSS